MAGINQLVTGNNAELEYKVYESGDTASSTFKSVVELNTLGDLTDTANVIDVPSFGKAYTRSIAGQKTAGPVDMTLNWHPANTEHAALYTAYQAGTKLSFKVKIKSGAEETYIDFAGFLSSFTASLPLDNVVTAAVQIAVDGGYAISHKA